MYWLQLIFIFARKHYHFHDAVTLSPETTEDAAVKEATTGGFGFSVPKTLNEIDADFEVSYCVGEV